MKIYPAIDIMNGEAVRLEEGKKDTKKIYGEPLEIAKSFARHVDKVHIVDLDGAFKGTPENLSAVEAIINETDLAIQMGGGIRTEEDFKQIKSIGVENPIIGTKALDYGFLEEVVNNFSGVTISLDIRAENLAVEGWKKNLKVDYREVFEELKAYTDRFIFTAVGSDGKLDGIRKLDRFWKEEKVIYAGGVTSREDLKLLERQGFCGAIIGKAIYESKLDLAEITEQFRDKDVS